MPNDILHQKNGYSGLTLLIYFVQDNHKVRSSSNFSHRLFKGYLRYKTITPQSVLSEAQVKNSFIS